MRRDSPAAGRYQSTVQLESPGSVLHRALETCQGVFAVPRIGLGADEAVSIVPGGSDTQGHLQ